MRKADRSKVASRASPDHVERQASFGDCLANLGEDTVNVDARSIGKRLRQAWD